MSYRRRNSGNATHIAARTANNENYELIAEDVLARYTQALLDLFTRSNSILSGQPVECIASDMTPIACTDGESVFFNPNLLRKAFEGADKGRLNVKNALEVLSHVRGVNLHELAHILYSPRSGSVAWNSILKLQNEIDSDTSIQMKYYSIKAFTVWNLLEDQRIESMFSAKYRNSVPYFQQTITKLLLEDPNGKPELLHLWVHGRRYIPRDIRLQARSLFQRNYNVTDDDMSLWESIIDQYRKLVFPRDGRIIAPLVMQFMELWAKYIQSPMPEDWGTTGGQSKGGHGERREGSADTSEQREAQEHMENNESQESDSSDSQQSDSDSDDENGESQSGARPDDSDTESNESQDGDTDSPSQSTSSSQNDSSSDGSDSSESADDANSPTQNSSDNGGGINSDSSGGQVSSISKIKLIKALEDSIAQASELVKDDLMQTVKQVLQKVEGLPIEKLFKNIEKPEAMVNPTPKFRSIANALNASLRLLRSDAESMWEKGVPTGRLNMDLVMKSEATDEDIDVFDQWVDSGDDAPRVEVVVLLDQSQSMSTDIPTSQSSGLHSTMAEASACVWSIKVACQQNEIPCTVIGYSEADSTQILYTADMRINQKQIGLFQYKSNTDPSVALKIAAQIFNRSEATNKILISISDGEWSYYQSLKTQMATLNGMGVETIFVALPARYSYRPTYDANGHIVSVNYATEFARGLDAYQGYDHKQVLKVANPTELAKRIGKTIVRASR